MARPAISISAPSRMNIGTASRIRCDIPSSMRAGTMETGIVVANAMIADGAEQEREGDRHADHHRDDDEDARRRRGDCRCPCRRGPAQATAARPSQAATARSATSDLGPGRMLQQLVDRGDQHQHDADQHGDAPRKPSLIWSTGLRPTMDPRNAPSSASRARAAQRTPASRPAHRARPGGPAGGRG